MFCEVVTNFVEKSKNSFPTKFVVRSIIRVLTNLVHSKKRDPSQVDNKMKVLSRRKMYVRYRLRKREGGGGVVNGKICVF